MARIRIPQTLDRLLQAVEASQFIPLLEKYGAIDSKGRYLHWNDFQWRVDSGDHELAAWVATKIARKSIRKSLPLLQAKDNSCFSYCVPNSLFDRLYTIDQMTAGGKEKRDTVRDTVLVSSIEKNRYLVKNLMQEEAITSSQLEGASTTREVAQEMLNKDLVPQDKSQQMILNNYRLMKKTIECKNEELSIDLILELHRIATHEAIENNAIPGHLRTDNAISVADLYNENTFYPPDWQTIESRLFNLCEFANSAQEAQETNYTEHFIHPIVKAIILHFMIAYIHPFGDGNGRTARAIFYWSILRSGYWLFEYVSLSKIIQETRGAYDQAFVYTETDEFDLTYFIYNQTETIVKAVKALYDYLERKQKDFYEFTDWIENSPIAKTLKQNHLEILKEALKKPGMEFTVKQVAIDFGVTENTARSYLHQLVDKNLLVSSHSKTSRSILYLAPANLISRLKL